MNLQGKYLTRGYYCAFCWCELTDGGIRFQGIGACPLHYRVACKLVSGIEEYQRHYKARFTNEGERKDDS